MDLRRSCALAAASLFLATAAITAGTTPATAVPVAGEHLGAGDHPWPSEPYRRGFRDGRKDALVEARKKCERPPKLTVMSLGAKRVPDYKRGYADGWEHGYAEGFDEFCY